MKLTFLGTRGQIDLRSTYHRKHTALLVEYGGQRVMIDCGEDWLGKIGDVAPQAIVLTHAHPDHAWGLKDGSPCPVYATQDTWKLIDNYRIAERKTVVPRRAVEVEGIELCAFTVEHSIRCPAVAYRITAGSVRVLYAPDLVYLHERAAAMSGLSLYIGDGATIERPLVRKRGEHLIGHSPVRTQLTWCQKENVPRAIITHCGKEIVRDHRAARRRIEKLAAQRGVEVLLAHDGWEQVLR